MKKPITATVRPAIPLALCLFGVLWVGVWSSSSWLMEDLFLHPEAPHTAGQHVFSANVFSASSWLLMIVVFVVVVTVVSRLAEQPWWKIGLLIVATLFGGMWIGQIRFNRLFEDRQWVVDHRSEALVQPVTITASQDPRRGQFGWSGEVRVELSGRIMTAQIRYPDGLVPLLLGQSVRTKAMLDRLELSEANRRLIVGGVAVRIKVLGSLSPYWPRRFISRLLRWRAQQSALIQGDEVGASLVRGLLLGDRTGDSGGVLSELFARCGLSHIMSVSGTHLALVASLVIASVGNLLGRRTAYITASVITLGYVVITGMSPATWRSWGMLVGLSAAVCMYRRPHALHALGLTGIVCLMAEPLLVWDIGFQMSVVAVLGIVLYTPWLQMWIRALMPKLPPGVTSSLAVTTIATVLTLPIAASVFGEVSRIGVLCNLIFVPLLSGVLLAGCGALLVSTVIPFASGGVFNPLVWVSSKILSGIQYVAQDPRALIVLSAGPWLWLIIVTIAVGVYVMWPTVGKGIAEQTVRIRRVRATLVALVCCVGLFFVAQGLFDRTTPPQACRITILDVGQGDATLIETPDTTFLIDAGPSTQELVRALDKQGAASIDMVLFTHDHADHITGADALPDYDIGTMLVAEGTESSPAYQEIASNLRTTMRTVGRGSVVADDYVQIAVLWPQSIPPNPDENDQSLIMVVSWQTPGKESPRTLLISGDAESAPIHSALSASGITDIDIVKVAHHGSSGAVDERLLATYGIEEAVISCGKDNTYGHPAQDTLTLLRKHNLRMWRTDTQGTYVIG